jgi:polyisoprenoid-binding protein YceI
MAKFLPILDRSEITLEGQSRLHPIRATTNELEAHFEVELLADGQLDLATQSSGSIEVLVEDLKSMNPLYDREVRKRLDMRRYPKIRADVVEFREALGENRYLAVGDVAFHGVTQRLEDELIVKQLGEGTIEIRGEITINVRDFKVNPPNLPMVGIMPTVQVKLRLVLERED